MKPKTPPTQAITSYLLERQEDMVRFLKALGAMETPSSDREAQQEVLGWLEVRFRQLGMYTIYVPGHSTGGYL